MNCRNCGAAMELFPAQGYFFCRYCGSFHFPESAGEDGLRLLGHDDRPATCPVCRDPMARALLDDVHPVHACEKCRGVLVPREAFARVVNTRRAWASTPPSEPRRLNPRDLERTVQCPFCAERMSTHPYYGPGNIVIDTCEGCDVVWLDFGELRQIADAPGRDRANRSPAAIPATVRGALNAEDLRGLTEADDPLAMLFRLLS
jgi:Zn-finger nucleic acid-binding protein